MPMPMPILLDLIILIFFVNRRIYEVLKLSVIYLDLHNVVEIIFTSYFKFCNPAYCQQSTLINLFPLSEQAGEI
jgi:hypothetical protein